MSIAHSSLTANENSTATSNGTLTSLNGYIDPVNLSCGQGAPPTCAVAPAKVTPTTAGAPFTVTVGSNVCGDYNFDIVAQGTDDHAVSHSVPMTFTSTSFVPPDYSLEINNSPLTAALNASATFSGTVTATAYYTSTVNLSCSSGSPPACKISPSSLTPTLSGTPFTVTVSSSQAQTYNFSIVGQGTDPSAIMHTFPVSFTSTATSSTPNFEFSPSAPGSATVKPGTAAVYTLNFSALPQGTAKFPQGISYFCSATSLPPLSSCSFSPAEINAGDAAAMTVTLTISTTPAITALNRAPRSFFYACGMLFLPGLILLPGRRWKPIALCVSLAIALALLAVAPACSAGLQGSTEAVADPGTPAWGPSSVIVTATMGSVTHSEDVTLTVQ
jgi:hypothetical protein